jgi:cell division protein FtsA
MDKPIAAIEISSSSLKLVVGHELDNQVIVLYTLTKPCEGLVENGEIINASAISDILKGFINIQDQEAKLKITISEVTLVLPPLGFEIYQNDKTTNVVSSIGQIDKLDISNVISLVRKETVPNGNEIVDIIPDNFTLDDGRVFLTPPIGEKSNTLSVRAKVHALPSAHFQKYCQAVENSGIHIKRAVVAPYAVGELYKTYEEVPKSYIYIDVGAKITTATLIGDGVPYSSSYILKGGDTLTEKIATEFSISVEDAEKIKRKYGLNKREISFSPSIITSQDEYGEKRDLFISDLNKVIEVFIDEYADSLSKCIDTMLHGYDNPKFHRLPFVLGGDGSRLGGFVVELKKYFPANDIISIVPKSLGARRQSYANCLGAIYSTAKYRGTLEDDRTRVASVSREEPTKKKVSRLEDDEL